MGGAGTGADLREAGSVKRSGSADTWGRLGSADTWGCSGSADTWGHSGSMDSWGALAARTLGGALAARTLGGALAARTLGDTLEGAVEEWALELRSNSSPRRPLTSPGAHELPSAGWSQRTVAGSSESLTTAGLRELWTTAVWISSTASRTVVSGVPRTAATIFPWTAG